MKRINIIICCILFSTHSVVGQDVKEILKASYSKCQSVQNGWYKASREMKFLTGKDTMRYASECRFKKLPDDTLFSFSFQSKQYFNNEYTGELLYNGNDFVITNTNDSTVTIMSKKLWANEIKAMRHNFKFYSPLTHPESKPLPDSSQLNDPGNSFTYIGEETISNIQCHHILLNEAIENEEGDMLKVFRSQYQYWISKIDFIPLQYSFTIDRLMNNDTITQYEKNTLISYSINKADEANFSLTETPSGYAAKDYVPYKKPEPLEQNSLAPAWELFTLSDEKLNLTELQGQLVLIDFFYKSCYPCLKALPALQSLHQKYGSRGLRVVGIDPIDKKEDDLASFLAKRGVTYTVVLGNKSIADDYRVGGYPSLYLLDRSGKIIFTQAGFGPDTEKELEALILKHL